MVQQCRDAAKRWGCLSLSMSFLLLCGVPDNGVAKLL